MRHRDLSYMERTQAEETSSSAYPVCDTFSFVDSSPHLLMSNQEFTFSRSAEILSSFSSEFPCAKNSSDPTEEAGLHDIHSLRIQPKRAFSYFFCYSLNRCYSFPPYLLSLDATSPASSLLSLLPSLHRMKELIFHSLSLSTLSLSPIFENLPLLTHFVCVHCQLKKFPEDISDHPNLRYSCDLPMLLPLLFAYVDIWI